MYKITMVGCECDWLVYLDTPEDLAVADYWRHYGIPAGATPWPIEIRGFETSGRMWACDLVNCKHRDGR